MVLLYFSFSLTLKWILLFPDSNSWRLMLHLWTKELCQKYMISSYPPMAYTLITLDADIESLSLSNGQKKIVLNLVQTYLWSVTPTCCTDFITSHILPLFSLDSHFTSTERVICQWSKTRLSSLHDSMLKKPAPPAGPPVYCFPPPPPMNNSFPKKKKGDEVEMSLAY